MYFQLAGDCPKDELGRNGLASLGGTRRGGLLGSDAERGPAPKDAGGCRQLPLPRAQGGQRSSRHQREGLCMTPPPSRDQPPTCHHGFWIVLVRCSLVSQCVTGIVREARWGHAWGIGTLASRCQRAALFPATWIV